MDLKATARHIFQQTLAAIDIPATMERALARQGSRIHVSADGHVEQVDLAAYERILAIVIGKAGAAMAQGLTRVLEPEFSARGILAVPAPPASVPPGFQVFLSGHPIPNEASFAAARAGMKLVRESDARTLVFFLLSGGGSALCELPLADGITLEDVRALNRALVGCGAPIDEINAVRKHLSVIKGGRLAAAAPAAMKLTLGVTDVPVGRESALASGPTIPDPTTVADVYRVVEQYKLRDALPVSVRALLDARQIPETPKAGDACFVNSRFQILLGMHELFHAAHRAAQAAGCIAVCDNATDDWPLGRAADSLLESLLLLKAQHAARPVCVIADGEISSPVTGDGLGGRNSAFVLDCVEKVAGKPIAVLSCGTDGADGNSPAAGAVADGETLARARAAGLDPQDYFRRSDAYTFFQQLGDAIETGPTGNNLRDLRVLLHA